MPVKTPYQLFTNHIGRTFAVRILPPGARYGLTNQLVNDTGHGPLVEFYDAERADDQVGTRGAGPLGRFVSRYFVTDLPDTGGLDLGPWRVDPCTMDDVRAWLSS